jgi:hypothetical protein
MPPTLQPVPQVSTNLKAPILGENRGENRGQTGGKTGENRGQTGRFPITEQFLIKAEQLLIRARSLLRWAATLLSAEHATCSLFQTLNELRRS